MEKTSSKMDQVEEVRQKLVRSKRKNLNFSQPSWFYRGVEFFLSPTVQMSIFSNSMFTSLLVAGYGGGLHFPQIILNSVLSLPAST